VTLAQARTELRDSNVTIQRETGGFRVNTVNGGPATSCHLDSLQDALETGKAMGHINRSWSFKLRSLVTGEESQSGQAFVEYALLLAVISLGIVASANILVSAVQTAATNIANRLVTASQTSSTTGQ
jgi:Flp pilus assembly pilin Flp